MSNNLLIPVFLVILFSNIRLSAQNNSFFTFKNGLKIVAPDSSASFNFNFNLQNRMDLKTEATDDWSIDEFSAHIKRFRMKFTGFVFNPKITYKIQLAMAPRNISSSTLGQAPRVMYDAIIYYEFDSGFKLGFGQTALPGNRQRINSSSALQMVDRSLANSTYNLDLDYGFHGEYKFKNQKPVTLYGAITTGEGQNWVVVDKAGFSYTGRVDWYPIGAFQSNGAYKEADLEWHPSPRLMVGLAYDYNESARRTGGQRGGLLEAERDISTLFADLIFKYQGWSFQADYYLRNSDNPAGPLPGASPMVYEGTGYNFQFGKYFRSKWEITGQLSTIVPGDEIEAFTAEKRDWTVGINRYIYGRDVKLQADFTLHQTRNVFPDDFSSKLGASLQAQIGF